MCCPSLFRNICWTCVLELSYFLLICFWGEPSPTRVFLEEYNGFSTFTFFDTYVFSWNMFRNTSKINFMLAFYFHQTSLLFGIKFCIVFSLIFDEKWLHKWPPPSILQASPSPLSRPFPDLHLDRYFGRPFRTIWLHLDSLWVPLGSFCHPLGSIWIPFGIHWAPFCSLRGSFWLHWDPFWLTFV